jgi:hypothetical protein
VCSQCGSRNVDSVMLLHTITKAELTAALSQLWTDTERNADEAIREAIGAIMDAIEQKVTAPARAQVRELERRVAELESRQKVVEFKPRSAALAHGSYWTVRMADGLDADLIDGIVKGIDPRQ